MPESPKAFKEAGIKRVIDVVRQVERDRGGPFPQGDSRRVPNIPRPAKIVTCADANGHFEVVFGSGTSTATTYPTPTADNKVKVAPGFWGKFLKELDEVTVGPLAHADIHWQIIQRKNPITMFQPPDPEDLSDRQLDPVAWNVCENEAET